MELWHPSLWKDPTKRASVRPSTQHLLLLSFIRSYILFYILPHSPCFPLCVSVHCPSWVKYSSGLSVMVITFMPCVSSVFVQANEENGESLQCVPSTPMPPVPVPALPPKPGIQTSFTGTSLTLLTITHTFTMAPCWLYIKNLISNQLFTYSSH